MITSIAVKKAAGARLREVRLDHGFSLRKFEKETGIEHSILSRMESGEREISLPLMITLQSKYNVNLNWLVAGKGPKYISK